MKKEFFLISSLLCLTLWLSSCESVVDIDISDKEVQLVLNSVVGTGYPIQGNVSLSRFILDDEPFERVEEAQVLLYENHRLLQSTLTDTQGNFTFEIEPEATKEYTLAVTKEGFTGVEASTFVPKPVDIQSVEVDPDALEKELGCKRKDHPRSLRPEQILRLLQSNVEFTIRFQDQPNKANFYGISTRIKAKMKVMIRQEDGSSKDSIYVLDLPAQMKTSDPALNGEELALENELVQDDEFIFDDHSFDGRSHDFKLKVLGDNFYPEGRLQSLKISFRLKSLSEEQYLYTKSKQSQDKNEGNPFAEPVPVFSNVKNGFGIFAAYSMDTKCFPKCSKNN